MLTNEYQGFREASSKLSLQAAKKCDWQDSVYQPAPGKLVKWGKNNGAGANVISDESIRGLVLQDTGT
jgi:hypothetical protein